MTDTLVSALTLDTNISPRAGCNTKMKPTGCLGNMHYQVGPSGILRTTSPDLLPDATVAPAMPWITHPALHGVLISPHRRVHLPDLFTIYRRRMMTWATVGADRQRRCLIQHEW